MYFSTRPTNKEDSDMGMKLLGKPISGYGNDALQDIVVRTSGVGKNCRKAIQELDARDRRMSVPPAPPPAPVLYDILSRLAARSEDPLKYVCPVCGETKDKLCRKANGDQLIASKSHVARKRLAGRV